MFLDLAGNHLPGRDFTEAFDAVCFPLKLFSSTVDPSWSSETSAAVVQGLLGMLVDGGDDNVNQCFLEASRFGSTEHVCILLQATDCSEEQLRRRPGIGVRDNEVPGGRWSCHCLHGPLMRERAACRSSSGS